jgi:hypothetical protein
LRSIGRVEARRRKTYALPFWLSQFLARRFHSELDGHTVRIIRSGLNEKTGRTILAFEESASMNARSIPRRLSTLILKRLAEFPAHGLLGPRQVG